MSLGEPSHGVRVHGVARGRDYATALRLGTAEAEQVLRRFTRGGLTALFW